MCPFCLTATLAWIAAGTASTGSLAATLVVLGLRTDPKADAARNHPQHGEQHEHP